MGGFSVQPAALTAFANVLGSSGTGDSASALDCEFLNTAEDYANRWVKLEAGAGGWFFSSVVGTMNSLCTQTNNDYSVISGLMQSSASGLTASATQYRTQDHATAEHLDSIYKPSGVTPLNTTQIDVSSPAVDPASKLTPPGEDGAFPEFAEQILEAVGYGSISGLVLKILTLLGLDVEDWVKERFVGDYKALAKSRNALLTLADFESTAATAVAEGATTMLKTWQGSAASAAQGYFDQLANAVAAHGNAVSTLAGKLDTVVLSIQQAGSAVVGALCIVIDKAMELAAAAAAAGCLQSIPGVDVLTDAVGSWKVIETLNKIRELGDLWGRVWVGFQAVLADMMKWIGLLQTYSASIKPPAVGYANTSQGQQPEDDTGNVGEGRGPQ